MKWFILSDIHANKPALDAVLKDIESRSPGTLEKKTDNKVAVLGDELGYMPYVNEVMDKVSEIADIRLIGNHDYDVYKKITHNPLGMSCLWPASYGIKYAVENLSSENKKILTELVESDHFQESENGILFTHAGPKIPQQWRYIESIETVFDQFFDNSEFSERIAFCGHTHVPQVYFQSEDEKEVGWVNFEFSMYQEFDLSKDYRNLIVVPSVGQPRDEHPYAGYAIYDTEAQKLSFVRLEYNIDIVQHQMKLEEFPVDLWVRLGYGI